MFRKKFFIFYLTFALLQGCNSPASYTTSQEPAATPVPLQTTAPVTRSAPQTLPEQVPPEQILSTPELQNATQRLLSSYTTELKNAKKSRANNIQKAAESINESVVKPGEVFSFNEAVGPTIKRRGYMLGRIFNNGKDSKGYGGGVCQVSGTLFNAVEQAGLEIVERHHHSKPVGYVPDGKDAATSYGVIDFKFANNLSVPVKIVSFVKDEVLTVNIVEV